MTTSSVPATLVFCGPSITAAEVRAVLGDALGADPGGALVTLPPAAQGDLLVAVRRHQPHTVVLIDGVFERVPAIWHKELLWAMDQGIHTFGASSMGALRAAELHPFGMVGVGHVFEQYRDGVLVDDDEVAVTHALADDDFRSLSTAMVDLRHLIATAVEQDVVAPKVGDRLLQIAKDLPYPQRSMPAVLRLATRSDDLALDPAAVEWLRDAALDRTRSRKHLDAQACLAAVAAHLGTTPGPFQPDGWFVEPTIFLTRAIHEVDRSSAEAPSVVDATDEETDDIALVGETPAVRRKQALLRILAGEVASVHGIRLDAGDVDGTIAAFRHRYRLDSDDDLQRWLGEHGLTWTEVVAALTDIARVDRVERAYRHDVDAALAPLSRFGAARRATPDRGDAEWRQCNIGLGGSLDARATIAREVFSRLAPALDGVAWFFQRKPPDIRLRVLSDRGLDAILASCADEGLVREHAWVTYEPEVERFGGPAAMAVAHAHFVADTQLWREVDQAMSSADPTAGPEGQRARREALFGSVAVDLVQETVPDPGDQARVWDELARLTADAVGSRALLDDDDRGPDEPRRRWLGPDHQAVFRLAVEVAERAAADLQGLDSSVDRCRLVALLVHFDANRWGVDGAGQRWLAETAAASGR